MAGARWRRWKFENFRYAFVHPLSPDEQHAAYETYVTPETGRVFFQAAFTNFAPNSPARVNFRNGARAPLMMIAGEVDRIVPASIVRRNFRRYTRSTAVTDLREFPGRSHWIIAQEGWQEVATDIALWLESPRISRTA